jgi:hypothetical protein
VIRALKLWHIKIALRYLSGYSLGMRYSITTVTPRSQNNTRSARTLATFFSSRHCRQSSEIFECLCKQLTCDSRTLCIPITAKFLSDSVGLSNESVILYHQDFRPAVYLLWIYDTLAFSSEIPFQAQKHHRQSLTMTILEVPGDVVPPL